MADLELLHNYTTSTYATLAESPSMREFYRVNVVQMGLRNEYITRTLLSLSGLQLAHHRPQSFDYYLSLASSHHQSASQTAMALMSNINSENAPMLFLFSNLTMIFAIGTPRQESDFRPAGESGLPDWMFLLRGVRVFHPHLTEGSRYGELAPLLQDGLRRWVQMRGASLPEDAPVKQHLDHVRFMIKQTVAEDISVQKVYLDTVTGLERIFATHLDSSASERADQPDVRMTFIWLFDVTDGMLPLLRVPEQEAAVLLAFFVALLHKSPSQLWWMQNWPEHLMAKIYGLLDEEHRLWIRWPMDDMGWIPPA